VKSVRLDADLQAKLERAARALATSQSEFIREALARRCDEVLGGSLAERLATVIGIVQSSGGRAARSGAAFRAALARRKRR
jgi:predicted DNA-binding protein